LEKVLKLAQILIFLLSITLNIKRHSLLSIHECIISA